jgi:hypothetical protein
MAYSKACRESCSRALNRSASRHRLHCRARLDVWVRQLPWADFNGNGSASDGRRDVATVTRGSDGGANGDGGVNTQDYAIWRDQLGQSDGMDSLAPGPVPEPNTLALFGIGTIGLISLKRYIASSPSNSGTALPGSIHD